MTDPLHKMKLMDAMSSVFNNLKTSSVADRLATHNNVGAETVNNFNFLLNQRIQTIKAVYCTVAQFSLPQTFQRINEPVSQCSRDGGVGFSVG